MLNEKDLKELIKAGKIKTSDIDVELSQENDLQKQKLELEKQKHKDKQELEKQKLELQKQKLELEKKKQNNTKNNSDGWIACSIYLVFLLVFGLIIALFVIK